MIAFMDDNNDDEYLGQTEVIAKKLFCNEGNKAKKMNLDRYGEIRNV